MYVLDYTVIAGGKTKIVPAVGHDDAFCKFVSEPRIKWGNHDGEYVPEDGETITVVGPEQDEYRDHLWRHNRVRALATTLAERGSRGGRRRRGEPSSAELREKLAEAEAAAEASAVPNHIVTFRVKAVTVYEPEYVSGLPASAEPSEEVTA